MSTLRPRFLALLLLAPLVACGDGGEGDTTCSISVAVSGAASAKLPGKDGVACLIQLSSGDGIDVEYLAPGLPVERINLVVGAITKGATGEGFPAALRVEATDGQVWTSVDCSVDVSVNELRGTSELGEDYQVRGSGECAAPLTDSAGASSVELSPFNFAVEVTWRS